MISETSCELHLNLRDQSRLRSSLSRTCLTAPNTLCVHKAASPYLPTDWSRCPHVLASSVSQYYLLLSPQQTSSDKLSCQTSHLWLTAFSRADGGVCHPLSLDELFLPHMVVILIPGCLRIFWDTTSTDFTLVCSSAATKYA